MKGLLLSLTVAVALTALVIWFVFSTGDPELSRTRALVSFFGLMCFITAAGVWAGYYMRGLGERLTDRLSTVEQATSQVGELLNQSRSMLRSNVETAQEMDLLRLRLHEMLDRLREHDAGPNPGGSG